MNKLNSQGEDATLGMGVFTGPLLFGHIVDISGSYQIAWLTMALSGAISVIFIALIREHKVRF